jgi:hypothetical protein
VEKTDIWSSMNVAVYAIIDAMVVVVVLPLRTNMRQVFYLEALVLDVSSMLLYEYQNNLCVGRGLY